MNSTLVHGPAILIGNEDEKNSSQQVIKLSFRICIQHVPVIAVKMEKMLFDRGKVFVLIKNINNNRLAI
jgi:hypothetical protein